MNDNEAVLRALHQAREENKVIYICTTVLVLGLYAMGAGGFSFWGLTLLLMTNVSKKRAKE